MFLKGKKTLFKIEVDKYQAHRSFEYFIVRKNSHLNMFTD